MDLPKFSRYRRRCGPDGPRCVSRVDQWAQPMVSSGDRQDLTLHRAQQQPSDFSRGVQRLHGPEPPTGQIMQVPVDQRHIKSVRLTVLSATPPGQLRHMQIVPGDQDDRIGRVRSMRRTILEPPDDNACLRRPTVGATTHRRRRLRQADVPPSRFGILRSRQCRNSPPIHTVGDVRRVATVPFGAIANELALVVGVLLTHPGGRGPREKRSHVPLHVPVARACTRDTNPPECNRPPAHKPQRNTLCSPCYTAPS